MNQRRTPLADRLGSPRRWRLRLAAFLVAAMAATGAPTTPASATTAGHYRAWGSNKFGMLGDGTGAFDNSSSPRAPSPDDGGWSDIDGGGYHTVALKSDGTVWTWGDNQKDQLGNGASCSGFPAYLNCYSDVPVQVLGLSGVTEIAGGFYHNVALKSDGTVWTWGDNFFGQLGNDTSCTLNALFCTSSVPVQVKAPTGTNNLTGVSHIGAGYHHNLAVVGTGSSTEVVAWGWNGFGQLGDGSTTNRSRPVSLGRADVAQVAAGRTHSVALTNSGAVVAWGGNSNGQLGDGTTAPVRSTPVAVKDGSGAQLSGVTQIDSGAFHSLARKQDATAVAWGRNDNGQLGNGTFTDSSTAQPVGNLTGVTVAEVAGGGVHSLVRKSDGTAVAFGAGGGGALGNGCNLAISGDCKNEASPVAVTNLTGVTRVGAGHLHSVALVS